VSWIGVSGLGAVSAAGWGVAALVEALERGTMPERSTLERPGAGGVSVVTEVAPVPKLEDRSRLPRAPRLRRASPVGRFAAAAALEALGEERLEAARAGERSIGVVCTMMNGCVGYSNRFFGEVLADPSVASPILFPETVYNAPSSHVSAMIGSTAPNDTLVGDGAEFLTGLELACEWLQRGDCGEVLVVAPEELDWLSAEAMGFYAKGLVPSEGAAAMVLGADAGEVELRVLPDPVSYAVEPDRARAFARLWGELGVEDDGESLWVDSRTGVARFDRVEGAVAWTGPRWSPRGLLGESLGAATGLQSVAAVEALRRGLAPRAVVTAIGGNEQVAGAVFARRG